MDVNKETLSDYCLEQISFHNKQIGRINRMIEEHKEEYKGAVDLSLIAHYEGAKRQQQCSVDSLERLLKHFKLVKDV